MNAKANSQETVTPSVARKRLLLRREGELGKSYEVQSKLFTALFFDIAEYFPNSVLADQSYFFKRLNEEGETFFLQTLPVIGKAVEVSLSSMEPLQVPPGWKLHRGTGLPKFMHEMFQELFLEKSLIPRYSILNWDEVADKTVMACRFLRQLFMMFSKVEVCNSALSTSLEQSSYKNFVNRKEATLHLHCCSPFLNEARRLIRCVLSGNTENPHLLDLRRFRIKPHGRQGPGAVAGKEKGRKKWQFDSWPGLHSALCEWRTGALSLLQGGQAYACQPSGRVCAVPKDFRGPRLICIEPKENQFAQQGLMGILYKLLSQHFLTRSSIDFFSTEKNRQLCFNKAYATIDLKDASDNLSLTLARFILPKWFFSLVTRYRTRYVTVPGFKEPVKVTSLATMGNATCFPLQTLIFWAIALGAMIVVRDSWPRHVWGQLPLTIRVFGDDIIVPLWACDIVCDALEACGLIINKSKTCQLSCVRESCGEWVFAGRSVRIFRFRTTQVKDHRSWLQWRDLLKDLQQEHLPALQSEARQHVDDFFTPLKRRYNKKLQRLECFAPTFVQRGDTSVLDGYTGLYAWHVHNDRTPFLSGARKRVKMRWLDMVAFERP